MFHLLFALCFVGAYLSADGERWRALHVTLGLHPGGAAGLSLGLCGWVGPRQAGLGLLWRKLGGGPAWVRTALQGRSLAGVNWRQGQYLLMALAVVGLLVLVVPLTLSGYAVNHDWGDAFGGTLGAVLGDEWLAELHEFFGNTMLVGVLAHLALIAGLSILRRKNQALPMLTGRTEGTGPDLVKRNRGWLAALLLLAVLAYGTWEWRQSPTGLVPDAVWRGSTVAAPD